MGPTNPQLRPISSTIWVRFKRLWLKMYPEVKENKRIYDQISKGLNIHRISRATTIIVRSRTEPKSRTFTASNKIPIRRSKYTFDAHFKGGDIRLGRLFSKSDCTRSNLRSMTFVHQLSTQRRSSTESVEMRRRPPWSFTHNTEISPGADDICRDIPVGIFVCEFVNRGDKRYNEPSSSTRERLNVIRPRCRDFLVLVCMGY
ncbi:hypothetical protein R3P38DRAFT_795305 [Favolaschia claudopus]|uniref:Uncharacterized protein n=1 Tax=Favolaschia claudopus TaxID=2862362 RepID=A0AAW0C3F3_9AGAR